VVTLPEKDGLETILSVVIEPASFALVIVPSTIPVVIPLSKFAENRTAPVLARILKALSLSVLMLLIII
jgi:hypothetical protein